MLIQLTTPRIVFNSSKHPEHVHLHTLSKPGVSDGQVLFTGVTNPEHGTRQTVTLEPREMLPLDEGMSVKTYVLPFWKLFTGGPKTAVSDGQIVRAASIELVRYCTAGFQVVAKSAFRTSPREYQEHTLAFSMAFAATGGGSVRLADSTVDFANPTFNPWAVEPNPLPEAAKDELRGAYAHVHALPNGRSDVEARRMARIAAANETPKIAEGPGVRSPTLRSKYVHARCTTNPTPSQEKSYTPSLDDRK